MILFKFYLTNILIYRKVLRIIKLKVNSTQRDDVLISEVNKIYSDGLFKKEAIQKIGGWNEDFIGISQENQFQDIKIKALLNYKELDYTGYHLFHRQDPPDSTFSQRNNQIMDTYRNATSDILNQHISQTVYKMGFKNKFSGLY